MNDGTHARQDEAAPRAPRPRPVTENGTTDPQNRQTTPPVPLSAEDAQLPVLPDVPHHQPGMPPHAQDQPSKATPDGHSSQATDDPIRQLDSLVAPSHDPDPLPQAPPPPRTRPVPPDAEINQRTTDLDSAARTAGIPKDQRDAHTRAIQE
ncbi:hypothetical protein I3F54_31685, partial [Streptomyces sp. MUM 2J]|nr:hypothetical protein [Streptomyces sp. MUM 2J]